MNDLLDQVIEAHGGLKNWRGVRSVDVLFNFSGGLLDLKGFPGAPPPCSLRGYVKASDRAPAAGR
jgi:hypothetical protein